MARLRRVVLILTLVAGFSQCAHTPQQERTEDAEASAAAQKRRVELIEGLAERLRQIDTAQGAAGNQPAGTGRPADRMQQTVQALAEAIRQRLQADMATRVESYFGLPAPVQVETVPLEAEDENGQIVEVPVEVETRPLRSLTAPEHTAAYKALLETDPAATAIYAELPEVVAGKTARPFLRVYEGDEAAAIAAEAQLIVTLKGGAWLEPDGKGPAANAVAVRGLDFERGLKPNGATTYDDTLYVVVTPPGGATKVFEYRMTTESSSTDKGVGRLEARQVTYVRGLHRKKDPAYQLKTGEAPGTRQGMEGTYSILGANIHSAYSRRPIDSSTPLAPNVSLGCQVIAAGKSEFEADMVKAFDALKVKSFPYTIVSNDEMDFFEASVRNAGYRSILAQAVRRK